MASPDEHTLTFLRGSGFLLSLVGVWDLTADASSPWPSQKGVLLFNETKITAVIERHAEMRRGVEGTYAVEGNRIILTELVVDTAPDRGPLGDGAFTLDGDTLTITWLPTTPTGHPPRHVDTFRRRAQPRGEVVLLPPVAVYDSDAPPAASRRDTATPPLQGGSAGTR
jgi:hypothetical protein